VLKLQGTLPPTKQPVSYITNNWRKTKRPEFVRHFAIIMHGQLHKEAKEWKDSTLFCFALCWSQQRGRWSSRRHEGGYNETA